MQMDYIANRDGVAAELAKNVKGEKFEHSIGVEQTAIALARRYGVDMDKAGFAGLLHDYTKQKDNIALAKKYNLPYITEKTLHGHTAAVVLADKGLVTDTEVLSAIAWHTTGRAGMTMLEKVIYVADYIEPNRDFEGVERVRALAFENIDKAVLMGVRESLENIIERKSLIDMDSVKAYNYYRKLFAEEDI